MLRSVNAYFVQVGIAKTPGVLDDAQGEYAERGEAIYRIAVDTAACRLKPWATARKLWLSTVVAHNLETFARKLGSDPFQWWATTAPVRTEMFPQILLDDSFSAEVAGFIFPGSATKPKKLSSL